MLTSVLPTVNSILALDVIQQGLPEVLAGHRGLEQAVRWVHVSEVREGARLLEGGELVLSTGIALPADALDAARYILDLAEAGACGLVVELSPTLPAVPASAVVAAGHHDFPLIVLHRSTRFVSVTEAVHRRIVDERLEQVMFAQHVQETFTKLSLRDGTPGDIVRAVADLTKGSAVLEDLRHRVLAHASVGQGDADLLSGWATRSREIKLDSRSGSWLIEQVGRQGQEWGRLIVPAAGIDAAAGRMVLERAGQALELGRMVERDLLMIELQAQGGFLRDLMDGAIDDPRDVEAKAHSLGLKRAARFIPMAVQTAIVGEPGSVVAHRQSRRLLERVTRSAIDANLSALVGPLGTGCVGLLVAVPKGLREQQVMDALSRAVRAGADDIPTWIGVDEGVGRVVDASSGLRRAQHVGSVAAAMTSSDRAYYRHGDLRLRGFLSLIAGDPNLQAFVEAELQHLLAHDARTGEGLVDVLRQFLQVGGSVTALARSSHRSRNSLYKRLAKISDILAVSLDDPESRTSLSVAMLAHDLPESAN